MSGASGSREDVSAAERHDDRVAAVAKEISGFTAQLDTLMVARFLVGLTDQISSLEGRIDELEDTIMRMQDLDQNH